MTVDDALGAGDRYWVAPTESYTRTEEEVIVLAAEVRRLRAENAIAVAQLALYVKTNGEIAAENERLREAKHVMAVNEGRLHPRIAQLETEVAALEDANSDLLCELQDLRDEMDDGR